jgi:GNAT superfamily N-acetyltransferase
VAGVNVEITNERAKLDVDVIHGFLTRSYWAAGISREKVERSLDRSLCFALLVDGRQAGFARVITDRTTFAYLCDVFVLEEHRGGGLGKRLIAAVRAHPDLVGLRRFLLTTRDAHGLYEPFGFQCVTEPRKFMEIRGEP